MLKALLIEDNAFQSSLLASAITAAGFEVSAQLTGQTGLDAFRTGAFDIAVIDLGLPDIAGTEIIQIIRSMPHGVELRIVCMTDSVKSEELAEAFRSGADDVYQKSIGHAVLAAKFEGLAAKLRAAREVTTRLSSLEQRMQDHVLELEQGFADKDKQISEMRELLECIKKNTEKTAEIVIAWDTAKGFVKTVNGLVLFVRKTWFVWAFAITIWTLAKTGEFHWPKLGE